MSSTPAHQDFDGFRSVVDAMGGCGHVRRREDHVGAHRLGRGGTARRRALRHRPPDLHDGEDRRTVSPQVSRSAASTGAGAALGIRAPARMLPDGDYAARDASKQSSRRWPKKLTASACWPTR